MINGAANPSPVTRHSSREAEEKMRQEVPLLTKSDYTAGLHCPKRLYLRKYARELEELSEGSRARMIDGQEVGVLAREAFPGGVLVEGRTDDALHTTRIFMEEAHTIFEAVFAASGRLAKVDVLQRADGGWRVIEVKSSKQPKEGEKPKPEHIEDLTFQVLVLRESGVNISSAHLMLLSRTYKAPPSGLPNPSEAFTLVDVSEPVDKLLMDTEFRSMSMLQALSRDTPPEIQPNTFCSGCGFYSHCVPEERIDDLVFMPRIKARQVTELRSEGVIRIADIPEHFKLQPIQARVREVFRTGEPHVSGTLDQELAAIRFPIAFIDFEATKWAIPYLPGTESHQEIPFQWSCHLLDSPDAEVRHREFLYRSSSDPRAEFARTLWEYVRGARSIFVYSGYEMRILKRLHEGGYPFASELCQALDKHGIDLLDIVQRNIYLPEFKGSFSIKRVLPAMVPGVNYDDLSIKEGETAAAEYKRMVDPNTDPVDSAEIARNLLAYCKRDTEAMVELLNALWRLSGSPHAARRSSAPIPDDTKHDQLALNI